jgi:hypothetical protein
MNFNKKFLQMMIIQFAYLSSHFYRVQAGKFTYRHYHVNNLFCF